MYEIEKLRQRLKNVKRGVTEYRMTILEAQALVREFDELKEKPQIKEVVLNEPTIITQILDGGALRGS